MEFFLEETVPASDLHKFEERYNEEIRTTGKVTAGTQFEYGWCLVRSKYPADVRKGIALLEDLVQRKDETQKQDYLFYLAIGYARIKEYQTSLKYIRGLLQLQPGNRQAQELKATVEKKMEREGLMGMAIVGGATLAFGALVGLGMAMAKK